MTLSEKKTEKPKIAPKTAFRTALVLSLSNPKAILFMLSFFLPFVDTTKGHPGLAFLTLAVTLQFWSVCYLTALTQVGKALLFFFGRDPSGDGSETPPSRSSFSFSPGSLSRAEFGGSARAHRLRVCQVMRSYV